jgi:hypothetical protein
MLIFGYTGRDSAHHLACNVNIVNYLTGTFEKMIARRNDAPAATGDGSVEWQWSQPGGRRTNELAVASWGKGL